MATTEAQKSSKEMRMMALSEQLTKINKSIYQFKNGSKEDLKVINLHKSKVLKKYKRMFEEDSDHDEEDETSIK